VRFHQPARRPLIALRHPHQFGMDQVDRAHVQGCRHADAAVAGNETFDEIEAHLTVVQAAVNVRPRDVEQRVRPHGPRESHEDLHREGGGGAGVAVHQGEVVGGQLEAHAKGSYRRPGVGHACRDRPHHHPASTVATIITHPNKPINGDKTVQAGLEQPAYFWTPDIAPAGIAFYSGSAFPAWKGNLFVSALAGKYLVRLVLDGTHVVAEERLLTDLNARIRAVHEGPDGAIYVLTDGANGKILRLVKKG
jgi:hypothetical protein